MDDETFEESKVTRRMRDEFLEVQQMSKKNKKIDKPQKVKWLMSKYTAPKSLTKQIAFMLSKECCDPNSAWSGIKENDVKIEVYSVNENLLLQY